MCVCGFYFNQNGYNITTYSPPNFYQNLAAVLIALRPFHAAAAAYYLSALRLAAASFMFNDRYGAREIAYKLENY